MVGRAPNPPEFASGFVSQEIVASDEDDFATELGVLARPRKLGNNMFRHQASEKCNCNKVLDTFLQFTRVFLKVRKCSDWGSLDRISGDRNRRSKVVSYTRSKVSIIFVKIWHKIEFLIRRSKVLTMALKTFDLVPKKNSQLLAQDRKLLIINSNHC